VPVENLESAPSAISHKPSVFMVLQLAAQRRNLVYCSVVAIMLLALVVAILMPTHYTASVVIMPPQNTSPSSALLTQLGSMGSLGALASAGGGLSIKNPNDLQVALLKSRTLEDAMVERFHLQTEYRVRYLSAARKRWEHESTAVNGLKDGLIHLSVTDRDPHRAAELANGWVEEYRHMTASLAVTEASQRRLFFEQELSQARNELSRAEDNLKATQQRTGVLDIGSQARSMIASAAMLRAQVAAKQVEIRAMREFAASQNPDLTRAEQELSSLESQLAAMNVASDRNTGDLVSPKGLITQANLEYTRALRETKYREVMYELMARQYELARVDEAKQGALIQVVDPAVAPDRADPHYRLWILLGALILAFPLALLVAWVAEFAANARHLHMLLGSWPEALEQSWMGVSQ
jgi:uncharacterized protein involved in exopolysaccharide biosynthesis